MWIDQVKAFGIQGYSGNEFEVQDDDHFWIAKERHLLRGNERLVKQPLSLKGGRRTPGEISRAAGKGVAEMCFTQLLVVSISFLVPSPVHLHAI